MTALTVDRPLSTLVVGGCRVPLVFGGTVERANLDHAASAAPLTSVANAVSAYLLSGQYAAVHRGKSWASTWGTNTYENARSVVRRFFTAPPGSAVIWTANTTGATHLIANALPPGARVVAFGFEHHANLLPWQAHDLTLLPVPSSHAELLFALAVELARSPVALVAVTGASNVTGEIPPLVEITELAHRHGALVCVDAAQLAAHHPINMTQLGVDLLAWSGHKLGAPLGVGGLVAAPTATGLLTGQPPAVRAGAVVNFVQPDGAVDWLDHPERRHEPGSPNVVGVLACATAMHTLMAAGMDRVTETERLLMGMAVPALSLVPGLRMLRMWPGTARIGVITFTVDGWLYSLLGAALAAEYGIDTRDGCFCAHPLLAHLLGITTDQAKRIGDTRRAGGPVPGAVRISFGLDTTYDTITRLVDALLRLTVDREPRWTYHTTPDQTGCWPDPDPRGEHLMPFDLPRKWTDG